MGAMTHRPDPHRGPKRTDSMPGRRSGSVLAWLWKLWFSPLRLVRRGNKLHLSLETGHDPAAEREPPPKHALAAAWRGLRRLFFSPLGLDRRHGKLHVALKPEVPPAVVAQEPEPAQAQAQLLSAMQAELKALLSQRPDTRRILRHLALLEAQLQRDGLGAFEDLPLDVLGRALEQLESLSEDFGSPGLGALRSRLQLALFKREESGPQTDRVNDFLSDFGVGQKVLVNEVTPSYFDPWRSTLPASDAAQGSAPKPEPEPKPEPRP